MNARKRQHDKWDVELKANLKGITWCEKCGSSEFVQVAHRKKRRLIGWQTEEDKLEYMCAAKLCQVDHQALDENYSKDGQTIDTHQIMFDVITSLIKDRDPGLVLKVYPFPEEYNAS
jgi:hypothetical protein